MGALKTGGEPISLEGMPTGYLLRDFWSWSASELLNNTLRGTYSEFLVGTALGVDLSAGYEGWQPWDLTYPLRWRDPEGRSRHEARIEVKSAAYLQPYAQEELSRIVFRIPPTLKWEESGGRSSRQRRQSDVYVFCLYAETDRDRADPLKLDGWEFYTVPTRRLDRLCGPQKTISLRSLSRLDPIRTGYVGIKGAVEQCLCGGGQADV